jgi:hypothetical protein
MGGCLRPSIWAATTFKNFLIVPLKATIFVNFTFTILKEILSFAPHCYDMTLSSQISVKSLWHTAGHPKNWFVRFYLPLLWERRPSLSLWHQVVKLFSPGSRPRIQLKSGMGIPEMNQKDEPRTGYKIHLRSGATGKKIFISRARCCLKS